MAEVQERRKKTVEASMTEQVHLIMQQHLNGGGRLFGGALMQWLDEVAGVVAMRHAETYRVVTAAVDNLQFKHAIYEGQIVVLKGYVTYVGRTSMEVEIDTYVEQPDGIRRTVNRAFFVMVAVDKDQKPIQVPELIITTEAEKARKLEDFVKDPNTISLEGLRALVVEDNELNMEIASFMLEDNGIIVDCAKDGLEAIGKFEKSEPGYYDVILMDIMMPNLNGWDTARRIRSMKRSDAERVPVIAMSANAFAEDIINSRISGMDEHLTIPLEPARLVNVLKDCIWRRKHKL